MYRTLGVYLFLPLLSLSVIKHSWAGGSPQELFESGQYQNSIDSLMEKHSSNFSSIPPGVYHYLLGLNYYHLNKLAYARGHFEVATLHGVKNLPVTELRARFDSNPWVHWMGPFTPTWLHVLALLASLLALAYTFYILSQKAYTQSIVHSAALLVALGGWNFFANKDFGVLLENSVIRSGPAESYAIMTHLSEGQAVEMTGKDKSGWLQISFDGGRTGWVNQSYLLALQREVQ